MTVNIYCSVCGEKVIDGIPITFDLPNGKKVCWDCKGSHNYDGFVSATEIDQGKQTFSIMLKKKE